jgi:hypothetical protein
MGDDDLVLGEGFDVVGDEDEGEYVLGAGTRSRLATRRNRRVKVPTPKWMRAASKQGVSRPEEEMDFLPFASLIIESGDTTGVLLARPQRPFRGERLIMSAFSAGTDISAGVVIDPAIYVGAVQVGANQGATPIIAFSATAFGVRLSFPAAGQGTDIKIFVRLVGGALKVDAEVNATIIGRSMR